MPSGYVGQSSYLFAPNGCALDLTTWCTLFDEEGNIIFSGDIDVSVSDSVITSSVQPSMNSANLFEFINVYPNPSDNVVCGNSTQNHKSPVYTKKAGYLFDNPAVHSLVRSENR